MGLVSHEFAPASEDWIMLFMVIEHFKDQNLKAVYRRFLEQGRMTPDGLVFVGSWVEASGSRCFQLMECDDLRLFQQWIANWHDLAEFEIVPVVFGKDTEEAIIPLLDLEETVASG
jgi:hypothetical protein